MSKYVKNLIVDELRERLSGTEEALLVDVIGLDVNRTVALRRRLREKNIDLMVVKNSLARRATEGTALAPAFEGLKGTTAVVWGGEDIVSLAKNVIAIDEDKDFKEFETRGGVMDGAPLSAEKVKEVSKWPSREEQLSLLLGQILSPGSLLQSQLLGPGGSVASQVQQIAKKEDEPT